MGTECKHTGTPHAMLRRSSPFLVLTVLALTSQLLPLTLPHHAFAQVEMDEFRVSRGATYTITGPEASMRVQRWIVEDGATIRLADDVGTWRMVAADASIGWGVHILGRGMDGSDGANGGHGRWGGRRELGGNGGDGAPGTDGSAGKTVTIVMGVREIHGLTIDVSGGRGGNGGAGGSGGKGGIAACGPPNMGGGRNGGNGGAGGNAGHGGNGGSVTVRYWPLADAGDGDGVPINIAPSVNGGEPGVAGPGGGAGPGGDGKGCPLLIPNQGAGNWGGGGAHGTPGNRGTAGRSSAMFGTPAP